MPRRSAKKERGVFEKDPGSEIWWIAELFSVPARIVEINDAKALEWQLVENSQRVDVHPYEEAQGFQRLLDIPAMMLPH